MKIIAIGNGKGGVGKTSCSKEITRNLNLLGKTVLAVDMDDAATLTQYLTCKPDFSFTLFEALTSEDLHQVKFGGFVQDATSHWSLTKVLPGSARISRLDRELSNMESVEDTLTDDRVKNYQRLHVLLSRLKGSFDYCIIDCPPTRGIQALNCLYASDYVLIPVDNGGTTFNKTTEYLKLIEKVSQSKIRALHDRIEILGIVSTRVNKPSSTGFRNLRSKYMDALGDFYLDDFAISDVSNFAEAEEQFKPIDAFERKSRPVKQYRNLTEYIVETIGG